MGKTASEIYYDMEEYENNLAIETLNRIYFDKIINPYKKSKKIIDMHTHTNYSDGDLSPQELIRLAIDKRIGTLAITDHDTIEGIKKITDTLEELQEECIIYKTNKDKYMPFNDSHLLKGRLSVTTKGYGFVLLEGQDDMYVDEKNMNGALNNDIVAIEPIIVKGKKEARVVRVLRKENILIVGEFNIINDIPTFTPDDEKLKIEIILDENDTKDLVDGHKIQVSIKKQLSKYKYLGEVVKVIGHKNDVGVDILSICLEHGISDEFNEDVLKELDSIPNEVRESDKKEEKI